MAQYKIKGSIFVVSAKSMREAIRKLVCSDFELEYYKPHWYTRINRKAWADVRTRYGYDCIIEEV